MAQSVCRIVVRRLHYSARCLVGRKVGRARVYDIHRPVTDTSYQDPNYFDNEAAKLPFDDDLPKKLEELYMKKIGAQRDLFLKADDQLVEHVNHWLPSIEPLEPKVEYQGVDSLKTAPESVKRIFSVEYGDREDLKAAWKAKIIGAVRRDPLDDSSLEARVAQATVNVRAMSQLQEQFSKYKKNIPSWLYRVTQHAVGHRRKLLRLLRETNLEAFERVLKELKIAYHVPALIEDLPKYTRKGWVEFQVLRRLNMEKERKMNEFHQKLKAQQADFMEWKSKRLQELDEEQGKIENELAAVRDAEENELKVVGKYEGHTVDHMAENYHHAYYYM